MDLEAGRIRAQRLGFVGVSLLRLVSRWRMSELGHQTLLSVLEVGSRSSGGTTLPENWEMRCNVSNQCSPARDSDSA